MAQKRRKSAVQNIVKNLVDSEIPEIQAVAKELVEWTKQLEEHSWRLQHYASEIESLSAEADESPDEASLAELVKDLEKTLVQLRLESAEGVADIPKVIGIKAEEKAGIPEAPGEVERKPVVPVVPEAIIEEKADSGQEEAKYKEVRETREERGLGPVVETYTTPEGFVVKKAKH